VQTIKRISRPVFTLHHTIEPAELRINSRLGSVRASLDSWLFKSISKDINGIIAVTPEILDFERKRVDCFQPGFVYPNGVLYIKRI
jgi:hypothetical protein